MTPPRFTLNERILHLCGEIMRLLGRYEGLRGAKPQPKLRRQNRIRTIQGSLAIEGNSLTVDQVSALLEGKRVLGPKKEILEVQNANAAYDRLRDFDPYSHRSLLQAHAVLMKGLIDDAGKWRSGGVGILRGGKVSHLAPKAHFVQGLVKELLSFVKTSPTTPLITSLLFHHEFEFIHPFSDGNGRLGRLWQQRLLVQFHPLFEFVPVESVVRDRQKDYYRALEQADRARESTAFVEFMCEAIRDAATETLSLMRGENVTPEDRLEAARERFQKSWFSRKDYQSFFVRLSAPTASRDLKRGVVERRLERQGEQALARYRFRSGG